MPEIAGAILSIVFVGFFFGFSIFIHELGHMLAALWRGMHVDKFSIGFGHRILSKRWKNIDFIIGWLPFGGYVALPQMDASGEPQTEDGKPLTEAKPMDRIITALAGPAFNILFALVLGTVIYFMGKPAMPESEGVLVTKVPKESVEFTQGLKSGDVIHEVNAKKVINQNVVMMEYVFKDDVTLNIVRDGKTMTIGPYTPKGNKDYEGLRLMSFESELLYPAEFGVVIPDSPAHKAGFKAGDIIKKIDAKEVDYFFQIGDILNSDDQTEFQVLIERDGKLQEFKVTPALIKVPSAGMVFKNFPKIMSVDEGYPAQKAGLQAGDRLTEVNGYPVTDLNDFKGVIERHQDSELTLAFMRGSEKNELTFIPTYSYKQLGVSFKMDKVKISPIKQINRVVENTYDTVKALVSPKSGVDISMMSSFVGISSGMYKTVRHLGVVEGLSFVLMINVALAIFNLLPFPVLDGGHIVVALVEMISRRKVPAGILQPVYVAFMLLLMTFALYATFNDIRREVDTRERVENPMEKLPDKLMRS